jgi:hypothetical protein
MSKAKAVTETITPEQIEEWKKKHGAVIQLKVGPYIGYVRKPTRLDFVYIEDSAGANYIRRQEALLNLIWLGGDEAIKTNDEYFLSAVPYLNTLLPTYEVELKNA